MFDFTLLRRDNFDRWPEGVENIYNQGDNFFYRQKVVPGYAAYTRGVQIIRPSRTNAEIFSFMKDEWYGGSEDKYVTFIAYDWRNKCLAKISTDPSATTNYFDAKYNTLPYETSPAFFRPEAVLKYKADRDKYRVEPRAIHCRASWTLRGYDVNEAGQVHAYVCDLRNIPYSEQLHWLSYNEEPKTSISDRAFTSDFKGEFSSHNDPLQDVLSIIRRWAELKPRWWKLRERRLLDHPSIPRTVSRDEWAEAFMDLAKLVIEGFDTKVLRENVKQMEVAFGREDGNLILIEKMLCSKSKSADVRRLEGLRTVQLIRSKVKGHSGSSEADQLVRSSLEQHENFGAHFEHTCTMIADELDRIEHALL